MAIVNLKEVLGDASKKNYAVGCFNTINYESVKGILEAAEEIRSPVIVGIAESQLLNVDLHSIMNILTFEAKRYSIPVVIHLDHGTSFNIIKKAIELGCSSVMYDGSNLPLEKNIENTKKIISYARPLNVSVEGEVGIMRTGNNEIANGENAKTDLKMAEEFLIQTQVDALAVSFGTVHGIMKKAPKLDLSLLEELQAKIKVPLVMHGGSGLGANDYQDVIKRGIRKINYFSYGYLAVANKIRALLKEKSNILYDEITYFSVNAFKEVFEEVMKMFGSAGKV